MINEFLSVIGKRSHAKASQFQLEILTVPEMLSAQAGAAEFQRDLRFYCYALDIPGSQMLTIENRVYDLSEKYVYMKAHDELSITIRIDKDYLSKNFFDAWEDSMYNKETGNVFYKSQYVGQVRISTMREDGTCPYSVILEDAFPTQIGSVALSWDSTGQIAQFTAIMSFTKKRVEARESLFTGEMQTGSTNYDMQFDVMDTDRVSTLKNNAYSSINNAFQEGLNQRIAMASSQLEMASFKQYLKF